MRDYIREPLPILSPRGQVLEGAEAPVDKGLGISCNKGPVAHCRLLIALCFLLGSLCLSVADSFAAGADTTAAEQLIRIYMKMGIVGTRVQAWLAASGYTLHALRGLRALSAVEATIELTVTK